MARWAAAVLEGLLAAYVRWLPTCARVLQALAALTLAAVILQPLVHPYLWRALTLPALALAGAAVFTFGLTPVLWSRLRLPSFGTAAGAARVRGDVLLAWGGGGAVCLLWLGWARLAVTLGGAGYRVQVLAAAPLALLWLAAACGLGLLAPRALLTARGTVRVLEAAMSVREPHARRVVGTSLSGGLAVAVATAGLAAAAGPGRMATVLAAGLAAAVALGVLGVYWLYAETYRAGEAGGGAG